MCRFLNKEVVPPLSPTEDLRGWKVKGQKVSPLHRRNQKHYKTCVILRIWLTEIDPIEPDHATNAYKTSVKSTFSMYGIYNVNVNVRREVQKSL